MASGRTGHGKQKGYGLLAGWVAMTEESARGALVAACASIGADPTGAALVRLGSNAVFRLVEPIIVRVARDHHTFDGARRQVAVSRWLQGAGYPVTRALNIEQPVDIDGQAVTFWESASERVEYAQLTQLADLLRRLHEFEMPVDLHLPTKQPFIELEDRLTNVSGVDRSDADFLRTRIGELQAQYSQLTFTLEPGVIHGDANVGNVILDGNGNPLLIDLDGFGIGPREWDLVQTALFCERFAWHTPEEYRAFVDVYGFDIMTWDGYPTLADYREIAMTLWLCGKADVDERAAAEVRKRVRSIRTGGDRRDWAPF